MANDNSVYMNGKAYPQSPGLMDSLKEGFMPTDQRARLEAIRRTMDKTVRGGATSNVPMNNDTDT